MRPRPAPSDGADRQLGGARGAAGQQQVGDVAAGDQQHEADSAKKCVEPSRVVADQLLESRDGGESELRIVVWIGLPEAVRIDLQFRERFGGRRVRLQSAVDLQVVLIMLRFALRGESDWNPELLGLCGEVESCRHHANHFVRPAVQRDLLADHRRIRPEAPRPQAVAENDDLFAAWLVLIASEHAAQRRRNREHLEEPQVVRAPTTRSGCPRRRG